MHLLFFSMEMKKTISGKKTDLFVDSSGNMELEYSSLECDHIKTSDSLSRRILFQPEKEISSMKIILIR